MPVYGSRQRANDFVPEVIEWKGWAPYGTDVSNRLLRDAAIELSSEMLQRVPQHLQFLITLQTPGVRCWDFKWWVGDPLKTREIVRHLRLSLTANPKTVNGRLIRAIAEDSPERKQWRQPIGKAMGQANKYLEKVVNKEKIEGVRPVELWLEYNNVGGPSMHGSRTGQLGGQMNPVDLVWTWKDCDLWKAADISSWLMENDEL